MKINTLNELLIDQIKDLHSAESQLVAALPRMVRGSSSADLSTLFQDHLAETKGHVARLKEAAGLLGAKPTGKTCKAMKGLIEECKEALEEEGEAAVLDVGIAAAAARVEHYEIAAYTIAVALADQVRNKAVRVLLQTTLNEENHSDESLRQLCDDQLFEQAAKAGTEVNA